MQKQIEIGKKVIEIIENSGHEAYFVGGVVRDFLMRLTPNDIDIASSLLPQEVEKLFDKVIPTGLKYGTVTVIYENIPFEITTFRKDGAYQNHRQPEEVIYTLSLEEDLRRRDFTINALAMTKEEKIIDYVGGIEDINHSIIRAVGDANTRFNEDSLRILRAFRFVSKCNFSIEEQTKKAMMENRDLLRYLANERILMEFDKLFRYDHPKTALRLMEECHLFEVYPELEKGSKALLNSQDELKSFRLFFTLCFYLNDFEIPEVYRLSNKDRQRMTQIMNLMAVTQEDEFQIEHLYTLHKDICEDANLLNRILNPSNDQSSLILSLDQSLPIRKTCDLAFKGGNILNLTDLKDATIIGDIIDDITSKVIHHELDNDYDQIKTYTMNTYFKKQD